jgi:hypothetical protein
MRKSVRYIILFLMLGLLLAASIFISYVFTDKSHVQHIGIYVHAVSMHGSTTYLDDDELIIYKEIPLLFVGVFVICIILKAKWSDR